MSSMSEFIVFEKEYAKSTRMTYYFRWDSEVRIRWTLTIPWDHGRGFVNGSEVKQLML